MASRIKRWLKSHWAWEMLSEGLCVATVTSSEDIPAGEIESITLIVELSKGGKAGGWWVYTTDSSWPVHKPTFFAALQFAERIRVAREQEMAKLEDAYRADIEASFNEPEAPAIPILDHRVKTGRNRTEDLLRSGMNCLVEMLTKMGDAASMPLLLTT